MTNHRQSYNIATISNSINIDNINPNLDAVSTSVNKNKKVDDKKYFKLSKRKCLFLFTSIFLFSLLIIAAIVTTVTILLIKKSSSSSSNNKNQNETRMNRVANLSYFMNLSGIIYI